MKKQNCIVITTPWLLRFMRAFLGPYDQIQWVLFDPPYLLGEGRVFCLESLSFFSFTPYRQFFSSLGPHLRPIEPHSSGWSFWQKACPRPLNPLSLNHDPQWDRSYRKIFQLDEISILEQENPDSDFLFLSPFCQVGHSSLEAPMSVRCSVFGTYDRNLLLSFSPFVTTKNQQRWKIWSQSELKVSVLKTHSCKKPLYILKSPMPVIFEKMLIYKELFEETLKNIAENSRHQSTSVR